MGWRDRRLFWACGLLLGAAAGAVAVVRAHPARLRTRAPVRLVPPLRQDEVTVVVDGPDGLPVPRGWLRHPDMHVTASGGGGGGGWGTFGNGWQRVAFKAESRDPSLQGQRWLEFWGALDERGTPLPFGAVLVGPLPSEIRHVTIHLPPEVPFEGSVRENGASVAGVKVGARLDFPGAMAWQGWGVAGPWHAEAETGTEGRFLLRGLSKGRLIVRFTCPPGRAIAGTTAEAGVPLRVDLGTPPWRGVTVTVVDDAGAGLPDFEVRVVEERAGPFPGFGGRSAIEVLAASGRTGPDGRIRIHGLAPDGNYALEIGPERHKVFRPGREIPGWRPSDTTLATVDR